MFGLNFVRSGGTVAVSNTHTQLHTATHHATMPRELRQSPALPAAFGKKRRGSRGRSHLSLPRTRRATPRVQVHPWSMMTAEIARQGPGSTLYEHVINRYCIEECEIVDNRRRIMTYWKSNTCSLCKDVYPRYSVCRHIGRIVDLDLNNRGGFLVSLPCASPLLSAY